VEIEQLHQALASIEACTDTTARAAAAILTARTVLACETWQFDAAGIIARSWPVPYAAVAVSSQSTAAVTVTSAPPQEKPPTSGVGLGLLGPGAAAVFDLAGRALTLYGTPGDQVSIEVYAGTQPPAWRNPAAGPSGPVSIFTSQTPADLNSTDSQTGTLGTAFESDVPGTITAIRYYKGSSAYDGNAITVGLYSAAGAQLGTASRTQTAADPIGWITVPLAPIAITAGATYVAAYLYVGTAHYVSTTSFFTTDLNNPPLHAKVNASAGPPALHNGLYVQPSATLTFPTSTFSASCYFVDVEFTAS